MSTEQNPYEGTKSVPADEGFGEATAFEVFANPSRSDDNKLVRVDNIPTDVEEVKDPVAVKNEGIDANESLPGVTRGIDDAADKKTLEEEAADRRENPAEPLDVPKGIDDAADKKTLEEADEKRAVTASGDVEFVSTETAAPTAIQAAEVPEGNIDEVLAWVGDDPEKAKQALEAEEAEKKPRVSLVKQLKEIK